MYFGVLIFAGFIVAKQAKIAGFEQQKWKSKADSLTVYYKTIDAVRGNILAYDGSLLATSVPFYEVGMDVNTEPLTDVKFEESVDSLSLCLARLFNDRSKAEYKKLLVGARRDGDRYIVLKRNVSYDELQQLRKFPLFRLGRYKGGFIFSQTDKRERPFKNLAARTIGYNNENSQPIGLEAAFDTDLKGISGKRLVQKISVGVDMPINEENEEEPQNGCDVVSTIDVNIQDVAESALMKQLVLHGAHHGCAILMEVQTGEVRAIANLTRGSGKDTSYNEDFNYAIGAATEPGSTFKLASLVAAMEDGYVKPSDMFNVENGETSYYGLTMKDSHRPPRSRMTAQEIFELSSNVGVSKIITNYYSKDPQKFVDRLTKMGFGFPLKVSIPGEAAPKLKKTSGRDWYGTTLPWMSIGYELTLSPLQTLTFYNAVANDGRMMRPLFAREIRKNGKTVKTLEPEVLNPAICSPSTVAKAKQLLEGVVEHGTGRALHNDIFRIAGKTGTAQIAKGGSYGQKNNNVSYQASFVGYFPADHPRYSCIVVVSAPTGGEYYGAQVAGPVFKEITDKVYATSIDMHEDLKVLPQFTSRKTPEVKKSEGQDLKTVFAGLKFDSYSIGSGSDWLDVGEKDSVMVFTNAKVKENLRSGIMPDVTGMGMRDALYLLENAGLRVKISGSGTIRKQSKEPGMKFIKGELITIELS